MARTHVGAVLRRIQHLIDSTSADELHDADLLQRFTQHRDEIAFTVLVRRHGGLVLNVCRHVLHHEADAEDAFQATFLILARQAASIRKRATIASWLHGVAFRTAMNSRRSAMRRQRHEQTVEEGRIVESPASQAALRELQAFLDEEIQGLSECYRAPFVLCCLQGKSRSDAAQTLGWKEGTVSSRLAKARKLLQERLTARGVTLSMTLAAVALSQSESSAVVAATLAAGTINAALAFTAGKAAGAVSTHVVAMTEGVLRGMFMAKLKSGIAVALVVLLGVVGASALVAQPEAGQVNERAPSIAVVHAEAGPNAVQPARIDSFGDTLPDGAAARLGSSRFRHDGHASALLFTPDGKSLVGYTSSGILLWDAATGTEQRRIPVKIAREASGMDVSPDGTTLAISEAGPGRETKVRLWELRTGQKAGTLSLPIEESRDAQFNVIRFSPDGKCLAVSYTNGGKAVVFDLASGKVRAGFGGRDSQAFGDLTISPDSKTLAAIVHPQHNAAPSKHGVQLWDIATGKKIRTIHEAMKDNELRSLASSPDGKNLAVGARDAILLFDAATAKKLHEFNVTKLGQCIGIAFTPDSKKVIAVNSSSGKGHVWDFATGKLLHVIGGDMFQGRAMALSPDGKTVAIGARGHSLRHWDVTTGLELFSDHRGHDSQINDLAFSPDGKTLVSAGDFGVTLVWNAATKKRIGSLPGSTRSLSFSSDGKHLATVPAGSTGWVDKVRIWDMDANKEASVITVPGAQSITSAIFSPDGRKLFTLDYTPDESGYGNTCLRHWDMQTGKQARSWPVPRQISWLESLAPDGTTLIASLQGGGISLRNAETGRTQLLPSPPMQWHSVLSPDGALLASGMMGTNFAFQVWEMVTRKEVFQLQGHQGAVTAIAWSPDGRLVASGDRRPFEWENMAHPITTQTVRLWNPVTGQQLASFGGFQSDVTALTFSPDGTTLVAGLRNSTILIWEVGKLNPKLMPAPRLSKDELESRWTDLLSDNAGIAHKAIGALVASPRQAVPFLQSRVKPTPVADPGKVQQWIADLNSDTFTVRQLAAQELAKVDTQVVAPIQNALKGNLSVETRRRLEQVLTTVSDAPDLDTVRTIRAIMALEKIDSPDARQVLQALARGAPGARTTEEAAASLKRLSKHVSPKHPA